MTHSNQNAPQYQGNTISGMIDANAYQILLAQPSCVGVRTYFALDQGALTIVVVGVDNNGNDMTEGIILDGALGCPPNCPTNSPLM
jgi:CobQ-like glutamine amidotransferase family enzyme